MTTFSELRKAYAKLDCENLSLGQLEHLRDGLKAVHSDEIQSDEDGKAYIGLLRIFREAVAKSNSLNGTNYLNLMNSLLSVGEDGLYSNSLRFIFELIQNVDDCEFRDPADCCLDMHFRFNEGQIVLSYNEVGFTPFNVFAITGIAEAAKNVTATKNQIGEKGIGFKSVFGVANTVMIRSGWFSFELHKDNFTIPVANYPDTKYYPGTQMTLYVPGRAQGIYSQIKAQYCRKDALFSKNPLLFLNKLTSLKMYFDSWRCMEFKMSSKPNSNNPGITREDNITLSVDLHDYENGKQVSVTETITCTRYVYPITYSKAACQARYGKDTAVGGTTGKKMLLQAVLPEPKDIHEVGSGALYSFLPTQLKFSVPVVCHVPFKLDASREFVDPQNNNLWFTESSKYLSELMDYVYQDWSKYVKADIIGYLPMVRESLFAKNNGKEQCLSKQVSFSGTHYLQYPLFQSIDGTFHKREEIYCFDDEEEIPEPIEVDKLMSFSKHLFLPQNKIKAVNYGIEVERNVLKRLSQKALSDSKITGEAIELLDRSGFIYSDAIIPQSHFELTSKQLEIILHHDILSRIFQLYAIKCLKKNMRPELGIATNATSSLGIVLQSDFDPSETPRDVEKYLSYCQGQCKCIDIDQTKYLPCYNGVILSMHDPLSSFASFCYAIDQKDTFAIRIKLKEASARLDQYVEKDSGTAGDYLRDLRNIRLLVRDSLGDTGYREYLTLIQKSGTDKRRFVQEILQNADDCIYPPDCVPTFSMTRSGNTITTAYNEIGFSRLNIRSITAIGESTKNKLLNGNYDAIGRKGVGFKTLFAVASEVRISSGEYHFALSDREPTIPKPFKHDEDIVAGTRMQIQLKDSSAFNALDEKSVLALVLCLRKLKKLDIGGHSVSIKDSDELRIINVDRKQYVFRRFVHRFTVKDPAAMQERTNGYKEVSPEQMVICYVPERNALSEYALYSGLPTKHTIKVPLAIDAPFELTTSREEIETDCRNWNDRVREEMYQAIFEVMDALKVDKRAEILQYTRFIHKISGNTHVYANSISDCDYINAYPFLNKLSERAILPTYDHSVFAVPNKKDSFRFPEVARILFDSFGEEDFIKIKASTIIDVPDKEYDSALNAFDCQDCSFDSLFPTLEENAQQHINDETFRNALFDYLGKQNTILYQDRLRKLYIIPVYSHTQGTTIYEKWQEDSIFIKPGVHISPSEYYILDEEILSKSVCERIMGVNINEMNEAWARGKYNEKLKEVLQGKDMEKIYNYLLQEFANGNLKKNDSSGVILQYRASVPLKNQLGEIVDTELYICSQPVGYFAVDMIQRISVHQECMEFAKTLNAQDLCSIHYEELDYYDPLSADDIEAIQDNYFLNSEEILRACCRNGQISDELLQEYGLEYLTLGHIDEQQDSSYIFPADPVTDREQLKKHVAKLWHHPIKIVSVEVTRTVQKGQNANGETFDLNINDTREGALNTYSPEGVNGVCFCQMCHRVRPYRLIEVNNVESMPRYYFKELRVALCLDCSKKFELLRNNKVIREEYISAIRTASIEPYYGTVDVPVGSDDKLTFTARHLAEIQEILKNMPKT